MLPILLIVTLPIAADETAKPAEICEVGREALKSLPFPSPTPADVSYFVDGNMRDDSLFKVCPQLRDALPAGYSIADSAAWTRANEHAPIPGKQTAPAFIYTLQLPKFSADGKFATLDWEYTCTGLCGGAATTSFIKLDTRWRREFPPRPKWVS